MQGFLPYRKVLHGKRGLDVSDSPFSMSGCHHSPLKPPSNWDAGYFPLLAAVKAASVLLGLLCSWGILGAGCICTQLDE